MSGRSLARTDYERYCRALARTPDPSLSPRARARAIPTWLCPELLATEAAVQKLQAWAQSAPQPWASPTPAAALLALHLVGDEIMLHLVARVIAALPPPVACYALNRVTYVAAGFTTLGFASPRLAFEDRPWLVVVGPGERDPALVSAVAVHEIAHTWLLPEPGPDLTVAGAFYHTTVMHTPIDHVPASSVNAVRCIRADHDTRERQAIALTRALGFADVHVG